MRSRDCYVATYDGYELYPFILLLSSRLYLVTSEALVWRILRTGAQTLFPLADLSSRRQQKITTDAVKGCFVVKIKLLYTI